ncbi:MAG: hypothetical protein ABI183_00815 [Polyangiaceae bacterium]
MAKTDRLETQKKPGIFYALTDEGIELPVIDITHDTFAVSLTETDRDELLLQFLKEQEPLLQMNPWIRNALLRVVLRGSILAKAIRQSRRSYLSGLGTYLLKLGPGHMGAAYAKPIDIRIAASLPALGARIRLQDVAHLLADTLRPMLDAQPGARVHFIDIAGGPAIDALNAAILVRSALSGHSVEIRVLDFDAAGPSFGKRALEALRAADAPLHGVDISLKHQFYDWNEAKTLRDRLGDLDGIAIGSSEGGLFEYGSDDIILANLGALRDLTPKNFAIAGSVTRNDEPAKVMLATGNAALQPRGIDAFRALVARAGWKVTTVIERFFSDHVLLRKD